MLELEPWNGAFMVLWQCSDEAGLMSRFGVTQVSHS